MAPGDDALDRAAGGRFGRWSVDAHGLPSFEYSPDGSPGLVLPDGGAGAAWHQVANQAITSTAHANGGVSLYSTRRGFIRLTSRERAWGLPGAADVEAEFGVASATWRCAAAGATVVRRVWAPYGEIAGLLVDVTVDAERPTTYTERWPFDPYPVAGISLMSPRVPPPDGYPLRLRASWNAVYGASAVSRALTLRLRSVLARRLSALPRPDDAREVVLLHPARAVRPRRRPAWFDAWIGLPFVARIATGDASDHLAAIPHGWGFRVRVPRGETRLRFAVGLADDEAHLDGLISELQRAEAAEHASRWGAALHVEAPDLPWLSRESTWHGTYLLGSETPDDCFGHSYPTQGSAYGFVHGLQGAPRDYAIASVPMTFADPGGAREAIRVMLRLTRPDGTMHYAHTGYGRVAAGGVHTAPTDLPIWLLWAITEYVWATGDSAFLDEYAPFHPVDSGITSTVRERVLLAFRTLRDIVGLGTHGMLHVGSGDWSDPIAMMVRDRRAFHRRGESGFNTGFAAYVLPRAASLVESTHPAAAAGMRAFAGTCREAMESAWNGRWFLRGWDGRGHPVGERHLFLDGQVWCLVARIGTDEQRASLVREIATRCGTPSPIGATILDRAHRVRAGMLAPGSDCNGGVWAAINALLAWGYALHDPELAWRSLAKQSLAAHAGAYPHVWYGIWSGPDAYNAHFGERPGETFVQPATPMTEFPVMNSNAHAGPLLAMLRVLGIETAPGGVVVADRGPAPPWRLDCALGTFSGGAAH